MAGKEAGAAAVLTGERGALSITCGRRASPPSCAPGEVAGGGARELLRLRCGRSRGAAAAAAAAAAEPLLLPLRSRVEFGIPAPR